MVHCCCVPGCSNRSDRESHLSFFGLPLKKKALLKQWIHLIGRKNLPVNSHTRICSCHFEHAAGRRLRPDEVPSLYLPVLTTSRNKMAPRRPPRQRPFVHIVPDTNSEDSTDEQCEKYDKCTQVGESTTLIQSELATARGHVEGLKKQVKEQEQQLVQQKFRLSNMRNDDAKVAFYTGFPSYAALKALIWNLLQIVCSTQSLTVKINMKIVSDAVHELATNGRLFSDVNVFAIRTYGAGSCIPLGLSQPTVSRIITTWVNFLYLKLKDIQLWMPRELVQANMPQQFKKQYPTTRVIIDATEIYVKQPKLPELQQMTFSNYKNDNTYKGLVGISPNGVNTFISSLYPGSISDKELTRRCGILDLLEPGDSVMADRRFDIEEDLALLGVHPGKICSTATPIVVYIQKSHQ